MNDNEIFLNFGLVVGLFIAGFVTGLWFADDPYGNQVRMAVEQCEHKLPRDQNCKYVISAEIGK